jgi:hypothetical protein
MGPVSERIQFADGGFAFLKGGFPYSQGVVALPGYAIERARFRKPLPLAEGFTRIRKYLKGLGRPLTAFCACELRSPRPFTFAGFQEFNEGYVAVLREWKLVRDGLNPVARSNVAPAHGAPREPCFHAFSYTVRPGDGRAGFVLAGSGEWPEGGGFPEDIVAGDDVSAEGMAKKTRWVLDAMDARLKSLRVQWGDATVAQVYTAERFDMDLVQRRVGPASVLWHWARPPLEGLAFEMDVRGVSIERVLD